jgi:exoribonuclease R
MAKAEQRANRVERAALDLAEAVVLSGRVGEIFTATVIDEGDQGVDVQLTDPAVLARLSAHKVDPGDTVRVRLTKADVVAGQIEFERVS